MTTDEAAEAILIAHQRRDYRSCLCGWSGLGKSHPGHQVAMLREAELLAFTTGRPACAPIRPAAPSSGVATSPGRP